MQQYKIFKNTGYECILQVENYTDYIHVVFLTRVEIPEQKLSETRKQFEMFMEPQELQQLITALQMSQYDWHQHNTHHEVTT